MLAISVTPYLFRKVSSEISRILAWSLSAGLGLYFAPVVFVQATSFYRAASALNNGSLQFHDVLGKLGGPTAFLTPDNTFRPLSVDSAICKGGTDIFQSVWGVSPFIKSMFPDRWCYLYGGPADLKPFANAVFIKLDSESRQSAIQRVESKFAVSLDTFDCKREIPAFGSSYILCHQDRPQPSTVELTSIRPDIVGVRHVEPRVIELRWAPLVGAEEYRIEMGSGSGSAQYIGTAPRTANSYRIADTDPSSTYRFRIQACRSSGACSLFSAEVVSQPYRSTRTKVPRN